MTLAVVVGLGHPPRCVIAPWFMSQRINFTVSVMYRYKQWQVVISHSLIRTELRMSPDAGLSIVYGFKLSFERWLQSPNIY